MDAHSSVACALAIRLEQVLDARLVAEQLLSDCVTTSAAIRKSELDDKFEAATNEYKMLCMERKRHVTQIDCVIQCAYFCRI